MKATIKRRLEALHKDQAIIPAYRVTLTNGEIVTLYGAEVLAPALAGQAVSITCCKGATTDWAVLAQKLSG